MGRKGFVIEKVTYCKIFLITTLREKRLPYWILHKKLYNPWLEIRKLYCIILKIERSVQIALYKNIKN